MRINDEYGNDRYIERYATRSDSQVRGALLLVHRMTRRLLAKTRFFSPSLKDGLKKRVFALYLQYF